MEYKGRKYLKLYTHLCGLNAREWMATFADIEAIIGAKLPPSARYYQAWWANDSSHSQGAAWAAAGWETAEVGLAKETLLFRRRRTSGTSHSSESRVKRSSVNKADGYAPNRVPTSSIDALDALDQLQTALGARGVDLAGWAQSVPAERRAINQ